MTIRLAEELKAIKPDYNKMASKLADAKKNLEDETLKRIDLQNKLQTMQEELKFENSILEQQLNEARARKQIEIDEVDSRVSSEYEQKLQSSLQVEFTFLSQAMCGLLLTLVTLEGASRRVRAADG